MLEGDRLYGRGGADDGYSAFAALGAIEAVQAAGGSHPRCVVVIEGSEESGSPDLPAYIDALAAIIGTPQLVVCLDSGAADYEHMWITTSLRGMAAGNLSVRVVEEGLHSGGYGGVVPDGFRILRRLLERIEDSGDGRVLLDEAWGEIPPETQAALAQAEAGRQVTLIEPSPGLGGERLCQTRIVTEDSPFVDPNLAAVKKHPNIRIITNAQVEKSAPVNGGYRLRIRRNTPRVAHAAGNTAFERCVVFHSLSKRSSVPGLRSGFVAGDAQFLARYRLYRTYHGCAVPVHTQLASLPAWNDETHVVENRRLYREKFARVTPVIAGALQQDIAILTEEIEGLQTSLTKLKAEREAQFGTMDPVSERGAVESIITTCRRRRQAAAKVIWAHCSEVIIRLV